MSSSPARPLGWAPSNRARRCRWASRASANSPTRSSRWSSAMAILVTGATGNVGRLVVDELLALGATGIRALTVDPARAALPPQIEVVRGYLGRPETVAPALDGVDRMYLAPLLGTVERVTRLAAEAGVRHIVDLAGGENTDWRPIEVA